MRFMQLIERLIPERQGVDAIAKRVFKDLQRLPDDPLISDDLIEVGNQIAGHPSGHDTDQMIATVKLLTQRQKRALILHVKHGYTYKQVAVALDITDLLALREIGAAYAAIRKTFV